MGAGTFKSDIQFFEQIIDVFADNEVSACIRVIEGPIGRFTGNGNIKWQTFPEFDLFIKKSDRLSRGQSEFAEDVIRLFL